MWKHVLWRKILWNPLLYNWISCYTNQIFGSVLMLTCMWRGRDLTTFPFEYGIASFHPFTSSNYHLHVIFPPVLQWRQNVLNLIIWASHFEPRHCIIFLFLGKLCLIIERHWKLWVWVGCLFLFRKFNVEKVHCGKATPPIKDCLLYACGRESFVDSFRSGAFIDCVTFLLIEWHVWGKSRRSS